MGIFWIFATQKKVHHLQRVSLNSSSYQFIKVNSICIDRWLISCVCSCFVLSWLLIHCMLVHDDYYCMSMRLWVGKVGRSQVSHDTCHISVEAWDWFVILYNMSSRMWILNENLCWYVIICLYMQMAVSSMSLSGGFFPNILMKIFYRRIKV